MLATAADVLPRGVGWAYEFKWDGVRALGDVSSRGVRLFSRRGNEITTAYPELVGMLRGAGDALLDGEIVAFVDGRPSFEALQARMHVRAKTEALRLAEAAPVTFVAFDLLRRHGVDLTARPYRERRAALDAWFAEEPEWTLSPSFDDGPATEAAARQHGLEGVVAKRVDSPYRPGARTRDWLKLRFVRAGDFVVVGWEAPSESPDMLSSLVLAMTTPNGLVFAGKAGSGLTGRTASALQRRLRVRRDCAVAPVPPASPGRVTHWVDPDVVVEIQFTLWTSEGRLRHPVFRRLREDKSADEAVGDG
ncbi:MAG TPA: non-homologous end-joining DNA ligase [Jatrophihabitantaceae bacterium]|jgi:bifunctional non-homologous end joining protein LigD|nr:non-homologous end-joining DNA ligase [Jatrophihabitantaceae bacterium]